MSQQSRFRVAASATPSATPGGSGAGGRKRAAPSGGNGGGGGADGPGASQAAKKRKMTRWNEATMACLCSCLIELADAGKQTDNQGFKAADLQDVSRTLQEQCGADFDAKQIRSKWDDMKAKWKEWCRHLGRVSGWGQDPNGVPSNEKEIEDAYFTQHPDSKIFRRKAPACRDQMETLLGATLGATQATGQHAKSLDQMLMGGEGGDDDDDEGWEDLLGEMMMSGANGLGPQADGGAAAAAGEGGGDGDDGLDDAGSDTSIETIGDNDTPSNPAHRGNTSARGNATNIPGRLTPPRPSTTRSHRKEDAAASSFERTMNR
ncbi:hypothetical protein E4U17_001920, partial [Claviceps sp. LM77 group G4]